MPEIKANGVVYLRQKLRGMGDDAERRFLALVSTEVAEAYRAALPVAWLPLQVVAPIYEHGSRIAYGDAPNCLRLLGHDVAKAGYTTIYRALLRVATIPFLLGQSPRFWHNHHSSGEICSVAHGANGALVTVSNYPELIEPFRESIAGYLVAFCELTGVHDLQVERQDEPPVWRWLVTWN